MFKKVLIANRGEIACRIMKTLAKMNIQSVGVYSWADRFSPHVKMADEAYCIGPSTPLESYLNIKNIIHVAQLAKVDAIHPGYGFLSENPEFAKACASSNICFIGPTPQAMQDVGSKQRAKELLKNSQVPLIPGYNPPNPNDQELFSAAEQIGWPVVLKAAHGGGGKGLKIVENPKQFKHAIESARREAKSYFNNDELLLEKLIIEPRHLEVQILGDHHGHIIHLFERDCSVQRRQQKIIEEAPAIGLSEKLRKKLYHYAIEVAKTFAYTNAGTVEFLLENQDTLYFMEMNARLQVEHPITEMITGIDLVEWQIRIAAGEKLTFTPPKQALGHAIECRICAEQPEDDFKPSHGKIQNLDWPETSTHQRIDTGIELDQEISSYYDSLLAKEIYWAEDRSHCIQGMQQMLKQTQITGLATNINYLKQLLDIPRWVQGAVPIDFLATLELPKPITNINNVVAVMDSILFWQETHNIPETLSGLSLSGMRFSPRTYLWDERFISFEIAYIKPGVLKLKSESQILNYQYQAPILVIDNGLSRQQVRIELNHPECFIDDGHQVYKILPYHISHHLHQTKEHAKDITSPMPATIVAILKNSGDTISQGEPLIILEAMKMEHTIYAPFDGIIKEFYYQTGQQVQEGQQLLELSEISE